MLRTMNDEVDCCRVFGIDEREMVPRPHSRPIFTVLLLEKMNNLNLQAVLQGKESIFVFLKF